MRAGTVSFRRQQIRWPAVNTVDQTGAMLAPLEPTTRTTIGRGRIRAIADRTALHHLLEDALIAHVGLIIDGEPVVLPTAFAVDLAGPDDGGSLYLHGSVAARWLGHLAGSTVCVTVTELDGLVAARSAFHHSMNYRSAVVIGTARIVSEDEERGRALDLIVDHMIPGRSRTLRTSTRKELAATVVFAVPLHEASMKQRVGGPVDDEEDIALGGWAGHIPLRRIAMEAVSDQHSTGSAPEDVRARAEALGAR